MAQYFGVKCKKCGTNLVLEECPDPEAYFIPPLHRLVCPQCKESRQYVSDEVFIFDTESPVFARVEE